MVEPVRPADALVDCPLANGVTARSSPFLHGFTLYGEAEALVSLTVCTDAEVGDDVHASEHAEGVHLRMGC